MPVRQKARGKHPSTDRCSLKRPESEGCQFKIVRIGKKRPFPA